MQFFWFGGFILFFLTTEVFSMALITIFTPSYNRKDKLSSLYNSLEKQSCKDFVWLIVDDGSDDGTDSYIKSLMNGSSFTIEYHFQKNSGKTAAHNKGVELTKTCLFTCVDSDDLLTPDCIEKIKKKWLDNHEGIIGILAFCSQTKMTRKRKPRETTLQQAYRKFKMRGDTMLIYLTETISKFRFPIIDGEKFVPENYLYDLLDIEGNLLLLPEVIYIRDYCSDGYTKNMSKLIKTNPLGY